MTADSFDCVIVGARCAGAPLATHLARGGMKVCVVDAAKLPSDQPISTHAIHAIGMDYLDELGVVAQIRAKTPEVRASRLTVGGTHVDIRLPSGREMYCPRRSLLDPLLGDAAVAAGADLRDETAVVDVLRDGERVTGVRVQHGGRTSELRARVVVGADGRNSTVARRVGAAEYHGYEAPRGGYWAYWPATRAFDELPFQTHIDISGTDARFAFRTDGDLVIAGALTEVARARTWKKDILDSVRGALASSPIIRTVVEGNAPASRFVGLMKLRSFYRQAVGPGWALVGDAGLHKDPTPGYGITDALRDAKALSVALLDGREAALTVYWRRRDVVSLPLYAHAEAMGALDYDNPFNQIVVRRLASDPALSDRLRDVFERRISPFDLVPTWRVLGWAALALLQGQTEIWPHLVSGGKRGAWVREEVTRRRALLEAAQERL